ncbi:hypothetical protein LSAT2_010770 [Lamellibrachia satsuma]|nr:hypothetical protein LSAT2_010770 [Lamellibrachia satsuma]
MTSLMRSTLFITFIQFALWRASQSADVDPRIVLMCLRNCDTRFKKCEHSCMERNNCPSFIKWCKDMCKQTHVVCVKLCDTDPIQQLILRD